MNPGPSNHAAPLSRRTLRAAASVSGRGLFTGVLANMSILPRERGGIVFQRTDLPGSVPIPALVGHIGADPRLPGRNTILTLDPSRPPGIDNPAVITIEHVMSALAGLGITDATVHLTAPEVPIGDGSAAFIAGAIAAAGTRDLDTTIEPIIVRERLVVRDERGTGEIVADPLGDFGGAAVPPASTPSASSIASACGLELSYTLDYGTQGGPQCQTFSWMHNPLTYARDVAPARTFCLKREAEAMRAAGLFSWVTTSEMLVLGDDGKPIDNEFRFPDEPARHKLLDLLGDLALAGAPIIGRITAVRSGHALNAVMARKLREHALELNTPQRSGS